MCIRDRERDVLLTYMMYQDGNKHLPDEVTKLLCERYGTTSVNLRKIKQRTLEKVKTLSLIHIFFIDESHYPHLNKIQTFTYNILRNRHE